MVVEKFAHNGLVIEIEIDENPESPREWDNLSKMVCFHRRYNFGDKHDYKQGDFNSWGELKEQIIKDHNPVVIEPLFMFDHSGQTISTDDSRFRAMDSAGWDWGQIGWVFVPRDKALEEYGKNGELTEKAIDKVRQCLLGEVETYDQYVQGEVYGYTINDPENEDGDEGEQLDSCWGYFGMDNVKGQAIAAADAIIENRKKSVKI